MLLSPVFYLAALVVLLGGASAQQYGYPQQPQPMPQAVNHARSFAELTLQDLTMLAASNLLNIITVCVGLYFLWGRVREALLKALMEGIAEGKIAVSAATGDGVKLSPREMAIAAAAGRQILVDAGFQVK